MKISQIPLAASLFAVASLTALVSTSRAATYTETTDAGSTLAAAADTTSAGNASSSLTTIFGTLSSASDADIFKINLASGTKLYASTVNTTSNYLDTALFLFDSTGHAIATNDDASGTSFDSSLPSGNTLISGLAAGTYYLAISSSGNEPVNLNNQLLFAGYPGGDTTAVRGAASGLNPTTESGFNAAEYDTTTFGAYRIDLVAVPEPSTWAALAAGSIAAGFTILRRRNSRA